MTDHWPRPFSLTSVFCFVTMLAMRYGFGLSPYYLIFVLYSVDRMWEGKAGNDVISIVKEMKHDEGIRSSSSGRS
jgi:hypothetical protein